MKLTNLQLQNFRNYESVQLEFTQNTLCSEICTTIRALFSLSSLVLRFFLQRSCRGAVLIIITSGLYRIVIQPGLPMQKLPKYLEIQCRFSSESSGNIPPLLTMNFYKRCRHWIKSSLRCRWLKKSYH